MSDTRRFRFLVNPASGGGTAAAAGEQVAEILRGRGHEVAISISAGVDAIADEARRAVEAGEIVVSVGGDGMVASLAGPMSLLADSGATLGLVPAGRGNDFARMLGVGKGPERIADRLERAEPRMVDVIDCGGVIVAGSIYAGIDSDAALQVSRMTRMPKPLQYPVAGLRAMLRYRPRRIRLVVDGVAQEIVAGMVVVANSQFYGKGMRVAPAARLDDGLLDVVVVEAFGKVALVATMLHIYRGTHVRSSRVQTFRGSDIELSVEGQPSLALGGDGEDLGTLPSWGEAPLEVSVRPRALRVL